MRTPSVGGAAGDVIRDTYNGEVKWLVVGFILFAVSWTIKSVARLARKDAK
jgi:hypothetical protein